MIDLDKADVAALEDLIVRKGWSGMDQSIARTPESARRWILSDALGDLYINTIQASQGRIEVSLSEDLPVEALARIMASVILLGGVKHTFQNLSAHAEHDTAYGADQVVSEIVLLYREITA